MHVWVKVVQTYDVTLYVMMPGLERGACRLEGRIREALLYILQHFLCLLTTYYASSFSIV